MCMSWRLMWVLWRCQGPRARTVARSVWAVPARWYHRMRTLWHSYRERDGAGRRDGQPVLGITGAG
jgi:hypothetical protein